MVKDQGKSKSLILWFSEIGINDVPIVGGKNASLGEMYRNLSTCGVKVPNGFAITATAYFHLLDSAGIRDGIKDTLKDLDTSKIYNLQIRGAKIRKMILEAQFPADLEAAIIENYQELERQYGPDVDVAVRSSGTAEDLAEASFAGQQDTYLNIRGHKRLIEACRQCFASIFTDRAISYREDQHFDHLSVALSIGIQKMVRSDKGASGVMFSIDTESGHKDMVLINASYGLGEVVVQGAANPDEFYIHKPTLENGYPSIISKRLGSKKVKAVYATGGQATKTVSVSEKDRNRFCISDKDALQLARWAIVIEKYFSRQAGYHKPMDIEWARDGVKGELFIVQARPETISMRKDSQVLEQYTLEKRGKILTTGSAVGTGLGFGRASVIKDSKYISHFRKGDVLVTHMTDPDWEPIMKIASAIVTDEGGRTSHAAIVSRELGIPAIVGAENATTEIPREKLITVSCCEGEVGYVYSGKIPHRVHRTHLNEMIRPRKTKIMMIFGTPEFAFGTSQIPNDGVGLARQEFIINSAIKIHPMALVNHAHLSDKKAKRKIDEITDGYRNKKNYYVDKLAMGIATIGAAFYPKDVIVRLSDFRSNEYADLIGGREFEPKERNPMIGWRGASRYYDSEYRPAFDLECRALKRVRDEMGLTNVKVMIPFCRTVDEGRKVIKVLAGNGLKQGDNGLELYVMCEVPSNVILADQFAEIFDGFSIGSNDLTQLTLGLDRDSGRIAHVGDENNEAVKRMVAMVIKTAKKYKRKIGICGQAPSDFPDFAKFLFQHGIDSISLNPDAVLQTTMDLAKLENGHRK